ncbi:MAG: folylpolyglutamate synthase/dihydrofolate synthase family protein [Verrucomicrobiota bacterium]
METLNENYDLTLQALYRLRNSAIKLGLENMHQVCAAWGNPQRQLKVVHIAGTNGKGTVAAVLASLLKAAGLKVGMYTSPHLITFRERIQVNGTLISKEDVARLGKRLLDDPTLQKWEPTFFEATTLMAWEFFYEQKVDVAVVEVGLGGRLDSTNVLPAENVLASVITSIGLDHTEFLGDTLEEIASEKAGIMKEGTPVFVSSMQEEVMQVLCNRAQALKIPLHVIHHNHENEENVIQWKEQHFSLKLYGKHLAENAQLALAVFDHLAQLGLVKIVQAGSQSIAQGLEEVNWPGRCQIINREPLMMIDGAHNEASLCAVLQTWRSMTGKDPSEIIFACQGERKKRSLISLLDREGLTLHLVPLESPRALMPQHLKEHFKKAHVRLWPNISTCWENIRQRKVEVLATGSLYLAGEILALVQGYSSQEIAFNWWYK